MTGDSQLAYNADSELAKMREDIVNRSYRLDIIRNIISIATGGAGLALMFLGGPAAMLGGAALAVGGPLVTTMITRKEQERLKIDREYLESKMQGGNWGKGNWENYRKEVAERGYAGPQAALSQGGLPPGAPNRIQRS